MNETSIEARIRVYSEDNEHDRTPLMWAVREKDAEVVAFLLSRMPESELRVELDKRDSWGRTALHLACSHKPDLKIIELLLDAGADTGLKDNFFEETPLIKAIHTTDSSAVQLLLQHGADITGENGREALEEADSYGLVAITALLKQAGVGN